MIKKAAQKDLDRIAEIYSLIHDAEERGEISVGWVREVYPTRQTAEDALARGDLFVEWADGQILAVAVINQVQMPAYADCRWEYEASDEEVMVLHTLVVDPRIKGRGYGTEFVRYYEAYAREHGCRVLRIDTQEKNTAARALYRRLGFREAGVVFCVFNGIPEVRLMCLEKRV